MLQYQGRVVQISGLFFSHAKRMKSGQAASSISFPSQRSPHSAMANVIQPSSIPTVASQYESGDLDPHPTGLEDPSRISFPPAPELNSKMYALPSLDLFPLPLALHRFGDEKTHILAPGPPAPSSRGISPRSLATSSSMPPTGLSLGAEESTERSIARLVQTFSRRAGSCEGARRGAPR
jgi:hypothetical protein